jgi:hypothetical protein
MKPFFSFLLFILAMNICVAQTAENAYLIKSAKAYKDFMFRNEATKADIKELDNNVPERLRPVADFIAEAIKSNNKIFTSKYLSRPSSTVLKDIFIVRAINLNIRQDSPADNNKLIDSLNNAVISDYELLDNYYEMIFTAVGNKNQPFDLRKADLKLNEYGLKDDTEKGIVFLRCFEFCGKTIWGYINVAKPQNTAEAMNYINKFPKVNGRPYFQYTDFSFPDFEMNIIKDKGLQSYKGFYLHKFYELLLSHLLTLNKEGASEKDKNDLLLGSILKETNYYKYTAYKETLEKIFKVQENNRPGN